MILHILLSLINGTNDYNSKSFRLAASLLKEGSENQGTVHVEGYENFG